MRILLIEDEPQLARNVSRGLVRAGHEVEIVHDGREGLEAALARPADLVVLDLNLPGLDGLSVLSGLRDARIPSRVLILTARGDVEHRVKGLKGGADDYLVKPFSMEELCARVEALGRRGGGTASSDVLRVDDLTVDVRGRRVSRAGNAVALSPREFDVLHVLVQEPGRVFSRTEICERVWQRDHEYDTRTVEIFITRLRRKLDAGQGRPLIHTVRGMGYSLHEPAASTGETRP